jgi:hypothetical protein
LSGIKHPAIPPDLCRWIVAMSTEIHNGTRNE